MHLSTLLTSCVRTISCNSSTCCNKERFEAFCFEFDLQELCAGKYIWMAFCVWKILEWMNIKLLQLLWVDVVELCRRFVSFGRLLEHWNCTCGCECLLHVKVSPQKFDVTLANDPQVWDHFAWPKLGEKLMEPSATRLVWWSKLLTLWTNLTSSERTPSFSTPYHRMVAKVTKLCQFHFLNDLFLVVY